MRFSQALIESAFLTFAPIILLSGDVEGMGVVTSTYDYGTMTYALVVIQVTLKVSKKTHFVRRIYIYFHKTTCLPKTNTQLIT